MTQMVHELLDSKPEVESPKGVLRTDLSIEDYHDFGNIKKHGEAAVISKSMLSEMGCPAKFEWKYVKGNQSADKSVFNVGNAVHTLALEPDTFHDRFYVIPKGVRRDKRTAEYQGIIAEANGRKMLLEEGTTNESGYDDIKAMAESIASNKIALALLKRKGLAEPSIFWTDPTTGVKLRCRPDFMAEDGLIVDLKTARDAEPEAFFRAAFDCHYDVSVGMTCDGYKALYGKMPDNYVFLVVEKNGPCIIEAYDSFRPFDLEDPAKLTYLAAGNYRYRKFLESYKSCVDSGVWPAYSGKVNPMGIPRYALKKLDPEQ